MEAKEAREKRNAYHRKWYHKNKEKHARHQLRYWKKKVREYERNDEE